MSSVSKLGKFNNVTITQSLCSLLVTADVTLQHYGKIRLLYYHNDPSDDNKRDSQLYTRMMPSLLKVMSTHTHVLNTHE